jgi:hypothetical protein
MKREAKLIFEIQNWIRRVGMLCCSIQASPICTHLLLTIEESPKLSTAYISGATQSSREYMFRTIFQKVKGGTRRNQKV